jgi:hypothetical protein
MQYWWKITLWLFVLVLAIIGVVCLVIRIQRRKNEYNILPFVLIDRNEEKKLKNMYFRVQRLLEHVEIPFIVHAGTMLGLKRHKSIIPWDDDLDILIHVTDLKKLFTHKPYFKKNNLTIVEKRFFEHAVGGEGAKIYVLDDDGKPLPFPFIDVFTYDDDGLNASDFHVTWKYHTVPLDWFRPFRKYPFYNHYAWGPNKLDLCLRQFFGDDYNTKCMVRTFQHRAGHRNVFDALNPNVHFDCADILKAIDSL